MSKESKFIQLINGHCVNNHGFSTTPNLGAKLRIQSLLPSLVADTTQKTPLASVRGATRAARPAGARGPLTA